MVSTVGDFAKALELRLSCTERAQRGNLALALVPGLDERRS